MKNTKSKGFTLLEILIATTILALIISATFSFMATSQDSIKNNIINGNLQDTARVAIDKITNDIRKSTGEVLISAAQINEASRIIKRSIEFNTLNVQITTDASGDITDIRFRDDDNDGTPDQVTIRYLVCFDPTTNEIDGNLRDDDGNGLVDEHFLVKELEDAEGNIITSVRITNKLQFTGNEFNIVDNLISLNLTTQGPLPRRMVIIDDLNNNGVAEANEPQRVIRGEYSTNVLARN